MIPSGTKFVGINADYPTAGLKSAQVNSAQEVVTMQDIIDTVLNDIPSSVGVTSVTGMNTDNTDPNNPIVQISVDGVTITGSGTTEDPLVGISSGVQSVTGFGVDNTDPLNPVVDTPTKTSDLINDGDDGISHFISLNDLPSNIILYTTNVSKKIPSFHKPVALNSV